VGWSRFVVAILDFSHPQVKPIHCTVKLAGKQMSIDLRSGNASMNEELLYFKERNARPNQPGFTRGGESENANPAAGRCLER
jgi:hypothetical protein